MEIFKVKQVDIQEYQYYIDCITNGIIGLSFLEKK